MSSGKRDDVSAGVSEAPDGAAEGGAALPGAAKERAVRQRLGVAAAVLEDALLTLRELPVAIERSTLRGHIDTAMSTLTRLGSVAVEQVTYLERMAFAAESLSAGRALLVEHTDSMAVQRVEARLSDVVDVLTAAREEVIDVVVGRDALRAPRNDAFDFVAKPFLASVGLPALYQLAREPLDAEVDTEPVDPAPLVPTDIDVEAAAELPDDPSENEDGSVLFNPSPEEPEPEQPLRDEQRLPVLGSVQALLTDGEKRQLKWMARDCLSTIATMGNLREPLEEYPWLYGEPFEQRLLMSLDALLALTQPAARYATREWNVLQECQRYAGEMPVPDRGRHFARALVLGCVEGEDMARAAVLAMRQASDMTRPAYRRALGLAPSAQVGPLLRRVLRDGAPALVAEVLEVLRFRREVHFEDIVLLTSHPEVAVVTAAASALGVCTPSRGVEEALRLIVDEDEDDHSVTAAATSLALHGLSEGLIAARKRVANFDTLAIETRQDLLRLLMFAGGPSDFALVYEAIHFTPREVTLAGWYGHVGMVPWLIAALKAANEVREETGPVALPMELSATKALYRMTGAALRDEPFEGLIYDFDSELAILSGTWQSWWEQHEAEFEVALRYRYGQPYSALQTVDELLASSSVLARRDAALELAMVTPQSRFEPTDWIARQRLLLSQIRGQIESAESVYQAGRWPAELISRLR